MIAGRLYVQVFGLLMGCAVGLLRYKFHRTVLEGNVHT